MITFPENVDRVANDVQQRGLNIFRRRMDAIAVGRFADEHIGTFNEFRITQQRQIAAPEIAAEDDPADVTAVLNAHLTDRRTQNVTGIGKPQREFLRQFVPFVIIKRFKQFRDRAGVVIGVERIDRRSALFQMPAHIAGVFLLNLRAVAQHDRGDVGRRGRAEDRSAKSGPIESRKIPAVINVRMRENDAVEVFRVTVELLVLLARFLAATLKKTAVEQHAQVVGLDEMLAAGDFSRRPEKRELHAMTPGEFESGS